VARYLVLLIGKVLKGIGRMTSAIQDTSWMIGGPQGSGVDSSATLFARTMAVAGYWVYGKREYHSNIKGKHSYFHLRVKTQPVHSFIDPVHLLASFEDSTAELHAHEIVPGGALVYDPSATKPEHLEIDSTVKLFPMEYDEIIKEIAEETGTPAPKLAIVKNTISVAASAALYGLSLSHVEEALKGQFRGKRAKLVPVNVRAAEKAYERVARVAGWDSFAWRLAPVENAPTPGSRLLMNGAAATGIGKLKAGCRFQTYYSITPAVDECIYLEGHPEYGIIVFQAEDELCAMNMTNGAALTGTRSSTATSGPGFCLKTEGIGWAGMNECPSVIFNYQRGGPSTGLPTRNEQGDLLFAVNVGHGDFPKIVMAPGDMHECFEDGFNAFNFAERYQTPVIVLVDKALANSTQTIDRFNEKGLKIDRGNLVTNVPGYNPEDVTTGIGKFKRFEVTDSGISPRTVLGTPGGIHWLTGDEHTEIGYITEDPATRIAMMDKRARKLVCAAKEIPADWQYKIFGSKDADMSIVCWGSSKGAALDSIKALEKEGISLNVLHIRLMSPFPVEAVSAFINNAKHCAIMESNFSNQLGQLIRARTGLDIQHKVVKYTGRPISETEVVATVKELLAAGAESRKVVLSCGH
jgi:2-oxoglutarate/2-oxoacid ferredoxin oxidoreductase subunit alpha